LKIRRVHFASGCDSPVSDLKDKLPTWLTPQIGISFANFLAIVFTAGMIYSSVQSDLVNTKSEIRDLKIEVRSLRQSETSIAVLKADTTSIKESVARIESRVDKLTR